MKLKTENKKDKEGENKEEVKREEIKKEEKIVTPTEEIKTEVTYTKTKREGVGFFRGLYLFFKTLLVLFEKSVKIVAIIVLTICASVFFLIGSLYFFSSTFGLKDSPAFQALRDRIGAVYAVHIEKEIREAEKDRNWEWKGELEALQKDIDTESKLREAVVDLQEKKEVEQKETLEELNEKIKEAENNLQKKQDELKEIEKEVEEKDNA